MPPGLGPEGDALDYRIPLIQYAIRHLHYPNLNFTYVDDYPTLIEIMMYFLYQITHWAPRITTVSGYVFFCLGSHKLLQQYISKQTALAAAVVISTMNLITTQDNLLMIDLTASAFLIWSFYYQIQLQKKQGKRYLILAAITAGAAIATRYSQVLMLLGAVVLFTYFSKNKKRTIKNNLIILMGAGIILSPWLIRNTVINSNPLFPLLTNVFPSPNMTPDRYLEILNGLRSFGLGQSITDFLLLPIRFAFHKTAFDYSVGPHILFFMPWILAFVGYIYLKKGEYEKLFPATMGFALTLIWFMGTRQARFLIPAIPFIIIAGMQGYELMQKFFIQKATKITLTAVIIAIGIAGTAKHIHKHKTEFLDEIDMMRGREASRSLFIPQKDIAHWLNQNVKEGEKVLLYERTGNLSEINRDFVFAYPHFYATSVFDYRNDNVSKQTFHERCVQENVRYVYFVSQVKSYGLDLNQIEKVFTGAQGGVIYLIH